LQLVDDGDAGVQKVALNSAPVAMSDALKARVESLRAAAPAPVGKGKSKKTSKAAAPARKKRK
jgi:hypothetical protein